MKPNTTAIIYTHASNLNGNLVEVEKVSTIVKLHNLLLIVDVAQTAGTRPINMTGLGIDVLCFTGHKGLMEPEGIGGMCIREGISIRPWKVGGTGVQSYSRTQPAKLPTCLAAGTLNTYGIAGLSAAVDYINSVGLQTIHL